MGESAPAGADGAAISSSAPVSSAVAVRAPRGRGNRDTGMTDHPWEGVEDRHGSAPNLCNDVIAVRQGTERVHGPAQNNPSPPSHRTRPIRQHGVACDGAVRDKGM
ncbi:hypothetical protein GCM10010390_49720 [Streptomyces mordarskii]|uniref:Uncharacterized protein n=1 Tax=Streptomyces mordarskii TaxID=1226758 RepID=A0ABN1DFC9_9ACTN